MADDKKLSELATDNTLQTGTKFYTVNGTTSGFSKYDQLCELIGREGLIQTGYDDLRVPVTATKRGGAKDPNFAQYKTNGAGSQGVFLYEFDPAAEWELFFSVQMPHSWKEGTLIYPHVHWAPAANGGAGEVVNWGLEYHWVNREAVFGNTTIIYGNTHTPADASLVADKHYKTYLTAVDATVKTFSSMLNCRIFRDATGAGGTDDYGDNALLLEVDFHYEIYRFGNAVGIAP